MAKMFPELLPDEVLKNKSRSSEVEVYNALKHQLDDEHYVFYSSPWLGTMPDGREIDGEADFLIAHAEKGMISVEVKGGRVKIDENDSWTSTDRYGITRNIKNPVEQARSSKHNLLSKLKDSHLWQSRFICVRHGVILPHVARPSRDFRPDMPLKLFAFDSDMKHLDRWVDARFGSLESDISENPLGTDGIYALQDMLAREIKLHVRLGTNVNQDLKEIKLKTDDQIFILREMEANHRMAIAGAAGTGKTVLALEKAIMLAEQEKRVLLLCYNRPLGIQLKTALSGYSNVTATHFHQYCRDVAEAASIDLSDIQLTRLEEELVENFINAELEEYDAVIIDEGQDFKDSWLTSLEVVVKAGNTGILYVFYDDNQNVMNTSAKYISLLPFAKHSLTRNFRNTKHIFNIAKSYYSGSFVRAIGPLGTKLLCHQIDNLDELKSLLAERIGTLIKVEGILPSDIAVLFPSTESMQCLYDGKQYRIGRNKLTDAENTNLGQIILETIRRFKGLESPVVLLVLDRETQDQYEILYTAISRAQAALEIFAPKAALSQFKNNS